MLKQWANKNHDNTVQIKTLHQGKLIWFLSDCVMSVLSGVVPINKVEFKKLEKPLRKLAVRRVEKMRESKIFIQILESVKLNSLRYLVLCFWSKMHTEEIVLILRQMYANEQPQITQLLNNKSVREKAKELSLSQRHKSPPAPSTLQQDTQQQTDNILETVKDELNGTTDEKIPPLKSSPENSLPEISPEIKERVLRDIKQLDRKKFEKASIILEKIEESESLSLDQTSILMFNNSGTGILVADFFTIYNTQHRSFHSDITKS